MSLGGTQTTAAGLGVAPIRGAFLVRCGQRAANQKERASRLLQLTCVCFTVATSVCIPLSFVSSLSQALFEKYNTA